MYNNHIASYPTGLKTDWERTTAQRGFTLVEMAVVLVIAGLIVAAVFRGQELIESSRVKSTVGQVQAVRTATGMFVDRYDALPGDFTEANATLGTVVGIDWGNDCDASDDSCDGDGVIEGNGINNETLLFWQHLGAANIITKIRLKANPDATFGLGLPSSVIGGGLTIRFERVSGKTTHWIRLGSAAAAPVGVVNSQIALEIDTKVDDGSPQTGSVRTSTDACTIDTVSTNGDPNDEYLNASIVEQCLMNFEL